MSVSTRFLLDSGTRLRAGRSRTKARPSIGPDSRSRSGTLTKGNLTTRAIFHAHENLLDRELSSVCERSIRRDRARSWVARNCADPRRGGQRKNLRDRAYRSQAARHFSHGAPDLESALDAQQNLRRDGREAFESIGADV